jgi:hypothetical protein
MQDAEESDRRAEVCRIGGDFQQSRGTRLEQQVIDCLLILQRERRELMWQREDHMPVGRHQQLLLPGGKPLIAGVGLTFWTMPVSTRVKGDGAIAALSTPIQVTAERRCAATLNGAEYFQLLPAEMGSVTFNKALARGTNDIGHLQGGSFHRFFFNRDRFAS